MTNPNAIRANDLRALLEQAVENWPEFDSDEPITGADLVEWFGEFRKDARNLLAAIDSTRPKGDRS